MIISISVAAIALGTPQVVSARTACTLLEQDLGASVQVAGPLKDDLVMLVPHGAGPMTVLEELAASLRGSVRRTTYGFLVERSKSDLEHLQQAVTAERVSWLSRRMAQVKKYRVTHNVGADPKSVVIRELDRWTDEVNNLKALGAKGVDPFGWQDLLPSYSLLDGLLTRINLSELASLPAGETSVYEDDPADGEKSLPPDQDLVATYEQAMQSFRDAGIERAIKSRITDRALSRLAPSWGTSNLARLRLVETASSSSISLELEAFDARGMKIDSARCLCGKAEVPRSTQLIFRAANADPSTRWAPLSASAASAVGFDRSNKGGAVAHVVSPTGSARTFEPVRQGGHGSDRPGNARATGGNFCVR
jgi:hypothetical protein